MKKPRIYSDLRPLWLGGLVAPLTGPLLFFLGLAFLAAIREGARGFGDWYVGLLGAAVFGLPPSYVGMWLLGMPYVIWLRRANRLSTFNICTGAILAGSVTFVFAQRIFKPEHSISSTLISGVVTGAVFGLLTGAAFCGFIGLWRRNKPAA